MSRFVTIPKFHDLTGYTEDAVRSKIKRGDWLQDRIWRKAPDGRVLIDMEAYEQWVLHGKAVSDQHRTAASRSTSTTAACAAASG